MTDQMTDQMKETRNYIDEMNILSEKIMFVNEMLALISNKRSKEYRLYKENISLMYDEIDRIWNDMTEYGRFKAKLIREN